MKLHSDRIHSPHLIPSTALPLVLYAHDPSPITSIQHSTLRPVPQYTPLVTQDKPLHVLSCPSRRHPEFKGLYLNSEHERGNLRLELRIIDR